jgi:murein DD-endopeptidase MepM/ murein hydrolase activator NlpD
MLETLVRSRNALRAAAAAIVAQALGACGAGSPPPAFSRDPPAAEASAEHLATAEPAAASTASTLTAAPKSKPARLSAAAGPARASRLGSFAKLPGSGALLWPVRGPIVRAFGIQPSGARIDGMDIAAVEGSPVLAVEAGVVTYAGGDLPGYGNMLLVAHDHGYTTVYAHNRTLLVGCGAKVRRGQAIATVGRTGDVAQALLHFQLRTGDRPVNPEPYLEAVPTMLASLDLPYTPLSAR